MGSRPLRPVPSDLQLVMIRVKQGERWQDCIASLGPQKVERCLGPGLSRCPGSVPYLNPAPSVNIDILNGSAHESGLQGSSGAAPNERPRVAVHSVSREHPSSISKARFWRIQYATENLPGQPTPESTRA